MNKRIVSVGAAVLSLAVLATAGFLAARLALAPLPGEWSVPLRMGPVEIDAGVPSLIRLATSAWGGPLLDGREFETRHGRLRLSWKAPAPCCCAVRRAPCSRPDLASPACSWQRCS